MYIKYTGTELNRLIKTIQDFPKDSKESLKASEELFNLFKGYISIKLQTKSISNKTIKEATEEIMQHVVKTLMKYDETDSLPDIYIINCIGRKIPEIIKQTESRKKAHSKKLTELRISNKKSKKKKKELSNV